MSKFKKGDKVHVYGYTKRDPREPQKLQPMAYRRGNWATVISAYCDDEILVKFSSGGFETEVHPMQCRKVKK